MTVGQFTVTGVTCGSIYKKGVTNMQMTNDEIVMRYRQAKIKGDQVQILAELNGCPVERIIGILVSAGIDNRNFNQLRKKLRLQEEQQEEQSSDQAVDSAREVTFSDLPEDAVVDVPRIPYKKPEIIEAPPLPKSSEAEDKQSITVVQAIAALYERVAELRKQKQAIDDELADISVQLNRIDDAIAGRE